MELRLLGSVEVLAGGRPIAAGPPQQRGVLAAVAVDAGRPVSVDTIVERLWSNSPPNRARAAVYVYISQLRKVLSAAGTSLSLERTSGGYRLDADTDVIDLHRFQGLVAAARWPGRPDSERVAMLREALGLWYGNALADLPGDWAARIRQAYNQLRLDATVLWAQAELRQGNGGSIVATLVGLTGEYPLAESLAAALMRALHATGCSAQALDFYAGLRRRLADQLGTNPSAHLQELHQTILRGEAVAV